MTCSNVSDLAQKVHRVKADITDARSSTLNDAFGAPIDVDTTTNYGGSHELNTAQGTVVSAHTSTAADSTTPLDGTGAPAYLPVWKYACFN